MTPTMKNIVTTNHTLTNGGNNFCSTMTSLKIDASHSTTTLKHKAIIIAAAITQFSLTFFVQSLQRTTNTSRPTLSP